MPLNPVAMHDITPLYGQMTLADNVFVLPRIDIRVT